MQARSSYDLANSRDPADWAAARAALQPGVERGTASVPEVKLLEKVCKKERDSACVRMCKSALRSR